MPKRSYSASSSAVSSSSSPPPHHRRRHKRAKIVELSDDDEEEIAVMSQSGGRNAGEAKESSRSSRKGEAIMSEKTLKAPTAAVAAEQDDANEEVHLVSSNSSRNTNLSLLSASRRLNKKRRQKQSVVPSGRVHASEDEDDASSHKNSTKVAARAPPAASVCTSQSRVASTSQTATDASPSARSQGASIGRLSLVTHDASGRKTYFDGSRFYKSRRSGQPITPNDVDLLELVPIDRATSFYFSSFGWDVEWFCEAILAKIPPSATKKVVQVIVGCKHQRDRVTEVVPTTRTDLELRVVHTLVKDRYGSMHSKLWMFEMKDEIRIVVGTANLSQCESQDFIWNQSFWAQDFPLKNLSSSRKKTSEFQEDLIQFLQAHETTPSLHTEFLEKYDFSGARATLVTSIPGLYNGSSIDQYGHASLHRKLRKAFTQLGEGTTPKNTRAFYGCSSLGSLSATFFKDVKNSMFVSDLGIVFPTQADADNIPMYGASGAGCIFLSRSQYNKGTFPRESFYRASSRNGFINHAKICLSIAPVGTDCNGKTILQGWALMGSHNLSVAAWGRRQKNGFFIRSYEISVLLPPQRYACTQQELVDRFGVHFHFPPKKYRVDEEPFFREFQ
eukprot:CAMPEP_0117445140 /NCGR_PEP_ID=MMETSP0759-20121206/5632_1 /TAXON_ID=63605 /ORGANISM="Percolomonas cosmopolitus, Strain WS" /LENGTH=615 /DNA_ID=CAMNT_0005237287 /DNA_START=105 /DNA_END=1952 /DNA_ORIENTATION=+